LETRGHARCTLAPNRALLECLKDRQAYEAEATTVRS
jgi:hypothetical protein